MVTALLARVPDAHTSEDSVIRLLFEVISGEIEGNYFANEILRNDIFVQLASTQALEQHGEMFGRLRKAGTYAKGTVLFSGAGGSFIPTGTQVDSNPGTDDIIYFSTDVDATIPNPGSPTAPSLADSPGAGNLGPGTYEYIVTFLTVAGETSPGLASIPLVTSGVPAHQINMTNIPLGGSGTTQRRVYRRKDGGNYALVTTIANNTATTLTDNVADGSLGAAPPSVSTAEQIAVAATATDVGVASNVGIGAINEVVDIPTGVSGVTSTTAFTGGSDEEEIEDYRSALLDFIRAPKSGSPSDMKAWAEEVDGVETATVFPNDNLGTPQAGHTTIRISGPGGIVPSGTIVTAVATALAAKDVANITIHVTTFTQVPTNVTVNATEASGFTLADITADVQRAITDYINSVPVGGTLYLSGIIDAVYGLTGVADVVVTTPGANVTSTSTQKITPGTISVT